MSVGTSRLLRYILPILLLLIAAASGCGRSPFSDYPDPPKDWLKPSVAVMKFENRAPLVGLGWDLGDGMRDVLVDRLVATRRFHVIERPEIEEVLKELRIQNSGLTRRQRRAQPGRLKNVQFLVKGTITDFGHTGSSEGAVATEHWKLFGKADEALISMTLYVVDVESGEIVCSESLERTVSAGSGGSVRTKYKDINFGGSRFYRTPLGRATAEVINDAVARVTDSIPSRRWQPRVAMVRDAGVVILNGGTNRGLKVGTVYEVCRQGEPIVDPETGDTIGRQPGRCVGRITIHDVRDKYSMAGITLGQPEQFAKGQYCRPPTTPLAHEPETTVTR
ncbi:MAG: CsgG/HfaB family protein [Phycisphaerae bacterium]